MKYKTIINRSGKKIDLHICQTQDGSYIIGIPEGMKDNAEKLNDVIDVEPIEL